MPRVFICYRREDSAPYAGRLHDRLSSQFGARHVFMDLESVGPGENFDNHIRAALNQTDVAVVVIGPRWLERPDASSAPRIQSDDDYVRREIAVALDAGIHVIPALVGRATLPTREQLPDDIRVLPTFQALELSDLRWTHDVGQLIDAIYASGPNPRLGRWAAVFQTKRSRTAILWTFRILTPLLGIGGLALLQTLVNAAHVSYPYALAVMMLIFGAIGAGLTVIEKRLGGGRV